MNELNIDGFRILEKIGGGATGDVYRAIQLKMDRVVALKVIPPVLSASPQYAERFMSEVRALAAVRHENIVAAFDAGRSGLFLYLAMEYVKGNTLGKIMERGGALDEKRVARIGLQVASALNCAYRRGLVHRDIKPQNILLTSSGAVKLCDMGFARLMNAADAQAKEGYTLGTPLYISPEQAKGEVETGTQSDIYSLGATLYHAVTGTPPFSGQSAAEIMLKHIIEYVEPPHERNPAVSEGLSYIIKKMMRKNPEKRYKTPAALEVDLTAFIEDKFVIPANWFSDSSLNLKPQKVSSEEVKAAEERRHRISGLRKKRRTG